MPGQAIQVGPFIGGLNTFSDASAIADNELSVCENFELDLDGSLKSRPPIEDVNIPFSLDTSGNINMLGYFYDNSGNAFLIASDGASSTYSFDGTAWTLITNQLSAAGFAQFDDKAWLTARVGSVQVGGTWSPTVSFAVEANMPKGEVIVTYKDRLWIAEGRTSTNKGTRLYRSRTIADPSLWPVTTDFVDIGSGDGQNIVNLAVYFNTLLIFRTNSIFGLQYAADPAAATVTLIVPSVGLNSKEALTAFESFIYFMHDDKAYEFTNNRASQINVKVPFKAEGSPAGIYLPYAVSEFNQRIIFSYFNVMFVYSLRTRTWTVWKSTVFGAIGKIFKRETPSDVSVAITHSSASVPAGSSRSAFTLVITDTTSLVTEDMRCVAQTKVFNYQASSIFKRLFWWGIDATFSQEVEGLVFPVTFNFQTTKFWLSPLDAPPFVMSDVDVSTASFGRKFVKFFKSLRFRQVFFRVEFPTDGSTASAPVRLFSLMTYVNPKETVSRTIN